MPAALIREVADDGNQKRRARKVNGSPLHKWSDLVSAK
jgi:hypothetical protein